MPDRDIPDRVVAFYEGAGRGLPRLRRALTPAERDTVEQRLTRLRAALAPHGPADRQPLGAALAGMMMVYPSMQRAGDEAAAVVAGYLSALADKPRWAIEQACERVRTGQAGCGEFCPSAPKLAGIVSELLAPYRAAIHRLEAVLTAPVDAPLPTRSRPRVSRPAADAAASDPAPAPRDHVARVLTDLERRKALREADGADADPAAAGASGA